MAAFFWIHAGANNNWATNGNWSATSGGGSNAAQPSATSDVTFDGAGANGNDASIVAANVTILSLTFTTGYTNTVTINTAVTLTIAGNFTDRTQHTWVVSGTGAMTISASSTITSNGKTFPGPVTFSGAAATKTISGNWTITGVLTTATNAQIINHTVAETITTGGINFAIATSGTIDIIVTTGNVQSGAAVTIASLTFTGGTITIGNLQWSSGNITYTSGTVTQTGGTALTAGTGTYNTAGIVWNQLSFLTGSTITITSLMSATTMALGAIVSVTFAGSAGWTIGTFTDAQAAAQTITLKNGITYTITSSFTCSLSRVGSIVLFTSDDATLKANLTLSQGSTCNVLASFTRIDASLGRPILSFNGTITTCTNVFAYTDVQVPPLNFGRKFGRRTSIYNRAKTVIYEQPRN